jgi:hypothetical protein
MMEEKAVSYRRYDIDELKLLAGGDYILHARKGTMVYL